MIFFGSICITDSVTKFPEVECLPSDLATSKRGSRVKCQQNVKFFSLNAGASIVFGIGITLDCQYLQFAIQKRPLAVIFIIENLILFVEEQSIHNNCK